MENHKKFKLAKATRILVFIDLLNDTAMYPVYQKPVEAGDDMLLIEVSTFDYTKALLLEQAMRINVCVQPHYRFAFKEDVGTHYITCSITG